MNTVIRACSVLKEITITLIHHTMESNMATKRPHWWWMKKLSRVRRRRWPYKSWNNSWRDIGISTSETSIIIPFLAPVPIVMMVRTISALMWTTISISKRITLLRMIIGHKTTSLCVVLWRGVMGPSCSYRSLGWLATIRRRIWTVIFHWFLPSWRHTVGTLGACIITDFPLKRGGRRRTSQNLQSAINNSNVVAHTH